MKRFTIILFLFVMLSAAKHLSAQSPDNPKVKRVDFKSTSAPATNQQARLYFETDSFKARLPNGTIFVFGGGDSIADYCPWDTTATAIIQKDTSLNVGIGTLDPQGARLRVLGLSVFTDSTGASPNQRWNYFLGNFGGTMQFGATNEGTGSGMFAADSFGNHNSNVYGIINGITYSSQNSRDISCEVGQRIGGGGLHTAQIEFHTDSVTSIGEIHFDVLDSLLSSIQLHLETNDSSIDLTTNGTEISITASDTIKLDAPAINVPQFAGSALKLAVFLADGTEDTATIATISPWTGNGTNVYLRDSTDNVAIGKSTATKKLDILGDVEITTGIVAPYSALIAINSVAGITSVYNSNTVTTATISTTNTFGSPLDSTDRGVTMLFASGSGDTAINNQLCTALNGFTFFSIRGQIPTYDTTGLVVIDTLGNVGIGTATPAEKLDVAGSVSIDSSLIFSCKTINTTAGDAATIDCPAGGFRKDATGDSFTLNNSYITANSVINFDLLGDLTTATGTNIINVGYTCTGGSATITFYTINIATGIEAAAPAANQDVRFFIIN